MTASSTRTKPTELIVFRWNVAEQGYEAVERGALMPFSLDRLVAKYDELLRREMNLQHLRDEEHLSIATVKAALSNIEREAVQQEIDKSYGHSEPCIAEKQPIEVGGSKLYEPLKENTGLFREFAETAPSTEGVLQFATRYGFLGISSSSYSLSA